MSKQTGQTFRNWNNTALSEPAKVVHPKDVNELANVVRDKDSFPSPLRVGGSFHSLNDCFCTTGTQIILDHFTDIEIDLKNRTVTVGAHVNMLGLRDALEPHKMCIEVQPEIGNATAGSVACCGTKDASLGPKGLGQISSCVVGVRMVDASGKIQTLTEQHHPQKMQNIRCSYGLLGVIFEVTFRIQPEETLQYQYAFFKLEPLPAFNELVDSSDGFLGFLQPGSGRLIVERRKVTTGSIGVPSRVKRRIRDRIWQVGATFILSWLPYNWWYSANDYALIAFLKIIRWSGGFRARRADSMLNFRFKRCHYFDFTFWAVPVSKWGTFVPAYLDFCDRFKQNTGFRPSLTTEIYFIQQDDHSPLSFSFDEAIFTMDPVDTRPNDPLWAEFNRRFNELAVAHGARPLLNQTKQLCKKDVNGAFGNKWKTFAALRRKADPNDRFLNSFFAALL